jgi:hypothetical protein
MARLKKGLLSAFSGAVGAVEGYELNGQLIIRSKRSKPSKPPTLKQLGCRYKMKLVNEVLAPCAEFIKIGYARTAKSQTFNPYNAAVAYQIKHAIVGEYPNYEIDPGKVRLAEGSINTEGLAPSVSVQDNILVFTWTPADGYPRSTDHVMLLVYVPVLKQAVYNLCGAKRRTGQETLIVPEEWQQQEMLCYMAFRSEYDTLCGDSIYVGKAS